MRIRIVPDSREFFADFAAAARNLATCVDRLQDVIDSIATAEEHHGAVKQAEREGDDITARILGRLETSFVTPFDPEDIQRLAEAIDDVVDDVYHVSELIVLTHVSEIIPEVADQMKILNTMAGGIVELFNRLSHMRGVRSIITDLEGLEREGNRVYRSTVARLFSGEMELLDVIRWKDISASLEAVLDRVEDMTGIVKTIAVKQA